MTESVALRTVVIGAGAGVFTLHRPALALPEIAVVGMADIVAAPGRERAAEFGVPFFTDYQVMLAETAPDLAVIIVPHTIHAAVAIACLRAGAHVLCEKPIARQVSEADAMLAASRETGRQLGVVFQHRFRPEIRLAHELIAAGALGTIQHMELTAFWTRAASYYRMGAWRGTWRGEGGGLLMNQLPHHLDLIGHLIGLPARVFASTPTQRHAIQTEDTVQGHLEWADGALGSIHASTAEAGPAERIQIVGTRGILEIAQPAITFWRYERDIDSYIAQAEPFGALPMTNVPLTLPTDTQGTHVDVYRDFLRGVRDGTSFVDGEAGRKALELANALILAGQTHAPVTLPIDRATYGTMLERLETAT